MPIADQSHGWRHFSYARDLLTTSAVNRRRRPVIYIHPQHFFFHILEIRTIVRAFFYQFVICVASVQTDGNGVPIKSKESMDHLLCVELIRFCSLAGVNVRFIYAILFELLPTFSRFIRMDEISGTSEFLRADSDKFTYYNNSVDIWMLKWFIESFILSVVILFLFAVFSNRLKCTRTKHWRIQTIQNGIPLMRKWSDEIWIIDLWKFIMFNYLIIVG